MLVFLLAHLIGDYYLQTKWIAEKKQQSVLVLLLHILIIAITMIVLNGVFLEKWYFGQIAVISLVHFFIDIFSTGIYRKWWFGKRITVSTVPIVGFLLDQLFHFGVILIVFGTLQLESDFASWVIAITDSEMSIIDPTLFALVLFSILFLLKPSSIAVEKAIDTVITNTENEVDLKKSMMIGYLERLITFFTIIAGTFLALTVVIGFKTWSQNSKLQSDDNEFTKKYLVGTMTSLLIAILLALVVRQFLFIEEIVIPQIT